ncbi:MAG: SIS domain-containing protein [Spirochaetota bacterium]|jgi:D-sedoheptulose 7-phosphate isomerase|nr:SIS domain-containing protein [Spirochaetota bacterium]
MRTEDKIQAIMRESAALTDALLNDEATLTGVARAADMLTQAFREGGRALFCGNGGSAADAQHFAAELAGKFYLERQALDAEALHVNTSFITAFANDHAYEGAYARLVQAKGRRGDVLVGISTSGKSRNIILALEEADRLGIRRIALIGAGDAGGVSARADIIISVPSTVTPRIQECHVLIGHILCELVEERLAARA